MQHIWLVDDDESLRWVLQKTFEKASFYVRSFADANQALSALQDISQTDVLPDVILSDICMPGLDGLSFLEKVHAVNPHMPVIIMTAHSDLDSAVTSYQTGAFEYLPKPFDLAEVVALVKKAIKQEYERQQETATVAHSEDNTPVTARANPIIGQSPAMQGVFKAIGRLAISNITVLITGESGTGKELIAHALHVNSPRHNKSFIALNMAAIPHDLVEAELFGHEKGAFTGATSQRKGRFEQANGGTLFLDEIGDMPYSTQTRLLRVLADGEFFRVGGQTPITVDVRIIAATHQNLEEAVMAKTFREDLFYRLNVIRIQAPALRERKEDIPLLIEHLLTKVAHELDMPIKRMNQKVLTALSNFAWPGNVRQLENVCRYVMVMTASSEVMLEDLPEDVYTQTITPTERDANHHADHIPSLPQDSIVNHQLSSWQVLLKKAVEQQLQENAMDMSSLFTPMFEHILIETTLTHTKGRKGEAATILGWGRNTLTRKLQD